MSAKVGTFFNYDLGELGYPEDKTHLNFSSSGWRKIALILAGGVSWSTFVGTAYCLYSRNVTVRTGTTILICSSSLGYLFVRKAKRVCHYDERAWIKRYKEEIEKLLSSEPEIVLAFIREKHGWENINRFLQPDEIKNLLRETLPFKNFFSAVEEYPELDQELIRELWGKWSAQKTILELFEECDFQKLKLILEDVHDLLQEKKRKWEEAIQPFKKAYDAHRIQTRKDPSKECSEKEKKLITSFKYNDLLARLKGLENGLSCKEIEFF